MNYLLIVSVLISLFTTLFFIPHWIKRAKIAGLTGKNMNKKSKEEIAEAGGVGVLLGFILGILSYVALKTFYFKSSEDLIAIFAILTIILIVSFIGLIDDILGWKIGLNKKTRLFFLLFASIPLIVLNIGESVIMGIEIGLIYPFVLVPIGIIATTSTFNFLAGYNGLESSQGIIVLGGLAFVCYKAGNSWLSLICLIMIASLFSFYIFNKYPAKILPGDILTYPIGALIGIIAIVGNIEKLAIFFYIPYILEVGLKIRGKLKKQSFAKPNIDGSLEMPYEKIYSLTHLSLFVLKKFKKKVYEKEVVYLINLFQIAIIIIGLLIFKIN